MNRAFGCALVAVALLAAPAAAQAHLVNTGLGSFYDGALHLLLSPGDLLGLIAAALLAGLRGARAARLTVVALTLSWLAAGMLGLAVPVALDLAWVSVLSFVILGALVAADARLSPVTVASIAALYGALHGFLNGSALSALGAGASSLLGIVVTVLLLALLGAAAVVPLRALWSRVAVRIAGSWLVAVGILMLGWLIQGSA